MGLFFVVVVSAQEIKSNALITDTVSDIDGNVYKTIKIGNKMWMAENLRTTKYNDGTPIPKVPDNDQWDALQSGAYCECDNNEANGKIYGYLYNWFAVKDGKICPNGWHVPSDVEISSFVAVLDKANKGQDFVFDLMEIGTEHWPKGMRSKLRTDKFGFTALPNGRRVGNGKFKEFGISASWWTKTEHGVMGPYFFGLANIVNGFTAGINLPKSNGLGIRCLKK